MTNRQGKSRCVVRLTQSLIMVACCAVHCTLEAKAAPVISEIGAMGYLSQFGYLPPVNPASQAMISEESFSSAISEFQSFVGIKVTGNLDAETARLMTLPRCGVKDKVGPGTSGRSKRYALFGTKWNTQSLTYRITKYPGKLDKTIVDREIFRALSVWSEYTDLTFSQKSGKVDIEIRFEVGDHGDDDPFDGPQGYGASNTLAHAYSPGSGLGGDAHFDASEVWTVDSYHGVNLFQVAAHEFGHSLGLDHSNIQSALMAPFYRSYEPNFKLHNDDIQGIQVLYGPKTENGGPGIYNSPGNYGDEDTNEVESNSDDEGTDYAEGSYDDEDIYGAPDICKDSQIDTMFTTAGHVYVFKGEHYWRLAANGIATGYPKPISSGWKGLPSNIDAAFSDENGRTYFFKGAEYWVYVNGRMDGHYPRKIRKDFPGSPDNIDAATVWSRDGNIYFYKGSKFWRFNAAWRPSVKRSHPKSISTWPGLPQSVDAAFSYGGTTYFFKGGAYYRFNDKTFSMVSASPYETGPAWFGCPVNDNEI